MEQCIVILFVCISACDSHCTSGCATRGATLCDSQCASGYSLVVSGVSGETNYTCSRMSTHAVLIYCSSSVIITVTVTILHSLYVIVNKFFLKFFRQVISVLSNYANDIAPLSCPASFSGTIVIQNHYV